MAGMINCMRFKPRATKAEALFKAYAEYVRDYPFDDIMHKIIDIMNRDNRVSQMLREYVEPYEDGENFHSFSGPVVNCDDYL